MEQVQLLQHAACRRIRRERKRRFGGGLLRAGANQLPACAFSQHEVKRLDDNGFSGARFASEHGKPIVKSNSQLFDQCDIPDPERPQHRYAPLFHHFLKLSHHFLRRTFIVDGNEHGVIACNGAENFGPAK